jgi:hypothetical protein
LNDLEGFRGTRKRVRTTRPKRRTAAAAYFDLCLLQREQERLEKELGRIGRRQKEIVKRLSEIEQEKKTLGKVVSGKPSAGEEEDGEWTTLPLDY